MNSAYFVFDISAVFSSVQVSASIIAGRASELRKCPKQRGTSPLSFVSPFLVCLPSSFFPFCFSCLF